MCKEEKYRTEMFTDSKVSGSSVLACTLCVGLLQADRSIYSVSRPIECKSTFCSLFWFVQASVA